jgi:hypothetical protein
MFLISIVIEGVPEAVLLDLTEQVQRERAEHSATECGIEVVSEEDGQYE